MNQRVIASPFCRRGGGCHSQNFDDHRGDVTSSFRQTSFSKFPLFFITCSAEIIRGSSSEESINRRSHLIFFEEPFLGNRKKESQWKRNGESSAKETSFVMEYSGEERTRHHSTLTCYPLNATVGLSCSPGRRMCTSCLRL